MLVVPVFTRNETQKVPWLCILLICINTLILFTLQAGDTSIYNEAYRYYQQSGLLDRELLAYGEYLQKQGTPEEIAFPVQKNEKEQLVQQMMKDDPFMSLLINDQLIIPESPNYRQWRDKRNRFEKILNSAAITRFGYSPLKNNIPTLFSCMFLHGDAMHLLGNMIFLYLIGAILEIALGPSLFLALYLITGMCASTLFGIVYPLSNGPLVGASGAISGLMGSYGVIFGIRRIRVFYSLGFFFNYATVPALTLFPFWLLNEFLQLYLNSESNVAYIAHIGGLLSGMLIGTGYKRLRKEHIDALFIHQETKRALDSHMDEGLHWLRQLEMNKARCAFAKALALAPANLTVIRQLYAVDKSRPDDERFHQSAQRLLKALTAGPPEEFLEIFEDYTKTAAHDGIPHLQFPILEHAGRLYLRRKEYRKAAPLISTLFRKNPDSPSLPRYLFTLADGFQQTNRSAEAGQCFKTLIRKYPTSEEAVQAKARLNPPNACSQPTIFK